MEKENLSEILRRVPLLAALNEEQLATMAKLASTKSFGQGKTIIKQGDPGAGLFVIVEGSVEVLVQPRPGAPDIKVNTLTEGDFFGEISLIDGHPRSATIKALTEVKVIELGRWVFMDAMRREPAIGVALLPVLTRRIRALEEHKAG